MSSKILELLRKIDEASSRQECFSVQRLTDDLRVLLAAPVVERQPVAIPAMPIMVDRRPYDDEDPDGYLESDADWGSNNPGAVSWLADNHTAIREALFTAPPELAELQATIAQLEAKLQPRTVRDVVSFAYIEEMSVRQISDLLTKQHDEITMLRNVVKAVAEQFDGGPDHPWIPGYNAKKIYNKVMLAAVPLRSAQSDEPSE